MAEQNNNSFGFTFEADDSSIRRADEHADLKDDVDAAKRTSNPALLDRRSKYLGLDEADREVTTRKRDENSASDVKPIPALRKVEDLKRTEGEEESSSSVANSASASSSSYSSSVSSSAVSARLSPSKVVSKGTLERKDSNEKKAGTGSGKPTLFVKPMVKPQVRTRLRHAEDDMIVSLL